MPEESYAIPLEKAKTEVEGSDATVISWGSMMAQCRIAVAEMQKQGKSIELIDLRSLSPMDEATIIGSVKKTGRVVVVQEAPRTLGLASEIISIINDHALLSLEAPVVRITGFDTIFPLSKLEKYYLPNAKRIAKGIEWVLNY